MSLNPGDAQYEERRGFFAEILSGKKNNGGVFLQNIKLMLAERQSRYVVDLHDIAMLDEGKLLVKKLLKNPAEYIPAWEDAVQEVVSAFDPNYHQVCPAIKIGFTGEFGRNHISVRGLTSDKVNNLVRVRGIVTKLNEVVPKLATSVHYCPKTNEVFARHHRDGTSLLMQKQGAGAIPQEDEDGNHLETEIGLSVYRDSQKFMIQELPEKTPTGQLPRYCEVVMEDDMVDSIKPGDRVEIIGVYRPMPKVSQGYTDGKFVCRLIVNNIVKVGSQMQDRQWTGEDIQMIKKIASRPDALDLLGRSFASNICGHEAIKKGLFLLMVGGVEKNLANGTHLRGDMNVLMMGDPSCGKSQLLRYCMNLAPNCISTTGRGSSGVGLTAAVTTDSFTKERRLEAGAMVLADRGVVCIDEFDKMSTNDRTAIHEVMEQQTVTIAKAGIHTSLNARCSVVAAANPIEGTWNTTETLSRNVNLPDSLLSRFDLIYIIRDQTTPEADRKIATQVLKSVRYRSKTEAFSRLGVNQKVHSTVIDSEAPTEDTESGEIFQKSMAHLYSADDVETPLEYLTLPFMKKYIRYVRENHEPVLSQRAVDACSKAYSEMRHEQANNSNKENDLVITTRTLEALIRISTAHAKMKCRDEVLDEDVQTAVALLMISRSQGHNDFFEEPIPEEPENGSEEPNLKRSHDDEEAPVAKRQRLDTYEVFQARLLELCANDAIPRNILFDAVNADLEEKLGAETLVSYLERMAQSGTIFLADDGSVMIL